MGFDVAGMLRQADEYLRRHVKSKAVRAAEKRREQRQAREAGRRLKRAALIGGASGAAILGVGTLVAPVALPVLAAAGGGALLLGAGSLFRPSRRRGDDGDFSQAELAELPGDAEDWLLERREGLPLDCRPPLDRIFRRLGDLQPHLATLAPHSTSAWEARRLLGDHLPRLVLAWEALSGSAREEEPEVRAGLRAALETVADALDELCREVGRDPMMTFETQNRFLEARYKGEDARLLPGRAPAQNRPSRREE
ncbi:MAG TPA: hypothetical protein VFQ67_09945 [Allosphingosinicella sp.]|jgi:hypothetical protein|nr:hypothetical protein [Allosphingosinicella sp.]